jgi:hypothetical protein
LDYLKVIRGALLAQLAGLGAAGDSRGVTYVCGQLTRTLEVYAKVTGEIADLARSQTFNITSNVAVLTEHPAFLRVQTALLRALGPHPAARADVVAALQALDSEDAPRATAQIPSAVGAVIEHEAVA